MSLRPDALTTLANLKAAVGIATADTSKDAYLEQCIDRATWLIEDMTGRKFNEAMNGGLKARKYTDISSPGTHVTTAVPNEDYVYFSGWSLDRGGDTVRDAFTGAGLFYLPAYPVRPNAETGSVTFALAVLNDRSTDDWDTTSHVENDTFIVDRPNGVLRLPGGFAGGHRNYRVTMCAGFVTIPPDIEALCIDLARTMFRDNAAVIGESIGTWSRQYSVTMLQEDRLKQAVLTRYSRPVF